LALIQKILQTEKNMRFQPKLSHFLENWNVVGHPTFISKINIRITINKEKKYYFYMFKRHTHNFARITSKEKKNQKLFLYKMKILNLNYELSEWIFPENLNMIGATVYIAAYACSMSLG
jgi:hypothetical protein